MISSACDIALVAVGIWLEGLKEGIATVAFIAVLSSRDGIVTTPEAEFSAEVAGHGCWVIFSLRHLN